MSIINQMLKDIEKRRNNEGNSNDNLNPLAGSASPETPDNKRLKILLLILLIVIIISGIGYFLHLSNKSKNTVSQVQQSNPGNLNAQAMISKISGNTPVTLSDVQSMHEETQTANIQTIELEFSTLPKYHLEKHLANHELVITFENTSIESPIELESSPLLKNYKTAETNGNLMLYLFFNTALDKASIKPDGDNLTLTLRSPIAKKVNEDNNAEEETPVITLSPKQKRELEYDEALATAQQGEKSKAIAQLNKILGEDPRYHQARESIAIMYLQQKNYAAVIQTTDKGLALDASYEPFVRLKARALLETNKTDEALTTLQTISPELSEAPKYYALLAVIKQRLGQYIYAAQIYRQLLSIYPENGIWWVGLGISLHSANQNNAALEAYKRALSTNTLKPNLVAFSQTEITKLGG